MAISLKTAGTWARVVADPSSVTIPGTPAAGDRMFLFANWKTFSVTVADPNGWTPIVNSFADGTSNAGNGSGSVSVAAWYRDWVTGDGNPSLNWSASPTEAHAVVMLWTKAGGDTWATPSFRTGAIAAADPFTVNASATVTVANASVVIGMIALADDSTTIARATDAIDDTGGLVTWNGNYVESPATHFNSTTGLDMSGDMGHRFVTTGAAAVTLHMDGDPAAAETGTALFVLQALFVSDPKTATPTTASLTMATLIPTVTASDRKSVTPSTASLSTATFAPSIGLSDNQRVTPTTLSLTTSAFAPTIVTPRTATPSVLALLLTAFAPTVATPILATPGAVAATLTTFEPTASIEAQDVTVTPDATSLSVTRFAPAVATPVSVIPPRVGLTLSAFAPSVVAPRVVTPALASLALSASVPVVGVGVRVEPSTVSPESATFAPTVTAIANQVVIPEPATFALTAHRPTAKTREPGFAVQPISRGGARLFVHPRPTFVHITTYPPYVVRIDDIALFEFLERMPDARA